MMYRYLLWKLFFSPFKLVDQFLCWLNQNKAPENKANPTPAKNNKPSGDKKKAQEKSAGKPNEGVADKAPQKTAEKDSECNVSILNIQVGLIRKAWKHPSADRYP